MQKFLVKIKTGHLLVVGVLILILSWIPYILLGTDSFIPYHDQLDGGILAYIYQAKYLFDNTGIIPEFLNGAPSTSLTPPAPLAVLFFYFFTPFTAYLLLQMTGQTVAFFGMFFLIKQITKNSYISFTIAMIYAFLPFLPVYGLAIYGAPLLLLCFWNLYQRQSLPLSYLYIALYAGMSSVILTGYAWIIIGIAFSFYLLLKKQYKGHLHFFAALFLLIAIYFIENISLITETLGITDTFISHRVEFILTSTPFFTSLYNYIFTHTFHFPDFHFFILLLSVGTIAITLLTNKQLAPTERSIRKWLILDILFIFFLYCICALWDIAPMIAIRKNMGAFGAFQFSRFTWITPTLWYIAFALCLKILWQKKITLHWLRYGFSGILILSLCLFVAKDTLVRPCIQQLIQPDYNILRWSDYYAIGVMEQVEEYLYNEEGLTKDSFKVASLGIDPSAALYHEFYCVDGYSNNYPLEYKIAFRPVIADELAKSEWLTSYYDDWGSRCYLHAYETMGYYTVEKKVFYYTNLELNTEALADLGCDYILSAAYIVSPEKMNLTLLNETPFETENSYYNIYIYKINSQK